jgi:hypothetical protein
VREVKGVENMTVSTGFFRRIQQWILDEQSGNISFLPFQVDGNPYKSKILLVGANPEPLTHLDTEYMKILADTLVDPKLFQDLFQDEIPAASREYKGSLNFASWMKANLNETVTLSSINCLNLDDVQLKQMKKEKNPLYLKGFEVFEEVVNEFEPQLLIIQGSQAYKLFIDQFKEQLKDYEMDNLALSVQLLEQKGKIAKFFLNSGKSVNVLVCRSMGAFGKEGKSFGAFKEILHQVLQ